MTLNKINSAKTDEIRTSESNITTNRTTNLPGIQQYIDSTLAAFDPLTNFYGQMNIQGLDFLNYQGRQRMDHELVNILVNGGQKYRTLPGSQERLDNVGPQRRRRRRRRRVTVVDEPTPLPKTR
ncbi:hypothetical protein BC941DRAFT_244793 [Chlamydoabsidia padenii]|nr:hypothetical protein BC941DRAFT_244793 [Chlamydoabsidia padenii]